MRRMTDSIEHQFGVVGRHGASVGVRSGYSVSHSQYRISPTALLAQARSALELR